MQNMIRYLLAVGLVLVMMTSRAEAKLVTKTVQHQAGGITFVSYLAYDDAARGKQPGVLVFPEWWGVVDFTRQKAEQLARMGYVALAVDMYGAGRTADNPQDAGKLAGQLQPPELRQRARAALEVLRKQEMVDGSKIAAIGFCFGGKVALQLAYSGADIQAVVTFHGELTPPTADEAKSIKAQILVCTGAHDPMASAQKVDAFWQALRDSSTIWEINIYSGAKHSFTNPAADKYNLPGIGYNAVAAERSWIAMQQLFHDVLERKASAQTQPAGPA